MLTSAVGVHEHLVHLRAFCKGVGISRVLSPVECFSSQLLDFSGFQVVQWADVVHGRELSKRKKSPTSPWASGETANTPEGVNERGLHGRETTGGLGSTFNGRISHPLHFGGFGLALDQLGPDGLPVVWSKVLESRCRINLVELPSQSGAGLLDSRKNLVEILLVDFELRGDFSAVLRGVFW